MKSIQQYTTINSTHYFICELVNGTFLNLINQDINIEQWVCISITPDGYTFMNTKNQVITTIAVNNGDYFNYISFDQLVLRYIQQLINMIKVHGIERAYSSKEFSLLIKLLLILEVKFNKVISLVAHYSYPHHTYREDSIRETNKLFTKNEVLTNNWKFYIFDKCSDEVVFSIRKAKFIVILHELIQNDCEINLNIISPIDELL